ncbi:hypothetical protein J132_02979 [Termitomyces sp. J132]|nr:hypothetical protein C0989_002025 [Termitomyces sp. Mn162]KNZ72468.1 hypothetical protein J132_02979 [Termitomyces sp. J132]
MVPLLPPNPRPIHPPNKMRRTATAVMAGVFDVRPPRDAFTCLLNGVPRYKPVENEDESARKAEKRKRKEQAVAAAAKRVSALDAAKLDAATATSYTNQRIDIPHTKTSGFWPVEPLASSAVRPSSARPRIELKTAQRSVSVTPPPTSPTLFLSTPASTPGPSDSSSTSRMSSKRPHTPDDEDPLPPPQPKPRGRKKPAVRKGWKGWVEGSPPPSEKLINLDAVPVLQERRTRSGKSFDAIGIGKEGWV